VQLKAIRNYSEEFYKFFFEGFIALIKTIENKISCYVQFVPFQSIKRNVNRF
jgi:hypothetical protein